MERNNHLRRHVASLRQSLIDQGYVDEQFIELEELQDDDTPNFVEEVVTLFYNDSARLIHNIDHSLEKEPVDFAKLDNYMHQFKGSSSSIGAKKVKTECTQFMEYCRAGNVEGCKRTFQQLKREYAVLRKKLEVYFQYARQAGPTESSTTSCRPK
ncbi:histidine-containing phosphotransfer protein 4-like isoform X2 [Solanum dulcamara]|uniref:histidine-containing phosphotransfer protein 4-like isoform X2 n=1 Tax=Solanum dulcamara TaxID=45834 RepID=UPI00248633C0|nr:histidine-containing phosphotransfer protein 4-like isoform X2 [Solanum dulcamara]